MSDTSVLLIFLAVFTIIFLLIFIVYVFFTRKSNYPPPIPTSRASVNSTSNVSAISSVLFVPIAPGLSYAEYVMREGSPTPSIPDQSHRREMHLRVIPNSCNLRNSHDMDENNTLIGSTGVSANQDSILVEQNPLLLMPQPPPASSIPSNSCPSVDGSVLTFSMSLNPSSSYLTTVTPILSMSQTIEPGSPPRQANILGNYQRRGIPEGQRRNYSNRDEASIENRSRSSTVTGRGQRIPEPRDLPRIPHDFTQSLGTRRSNRRWTDAQQPQPTLFRTE